MMAHGPITVDLSRNMVCRNGHEIRVQPRCAEVIAYFVDRPGRVVSRVDIECSVLGMFEDQSPKLVDVHLCRARKTIRALGGDIINRHGMGWELVIGSSDPPSITLPSDVATRLDDMARKTGFSRDAIAADILSRALSRSSNRPGSQPS